MTAVEDFVPINRIRAGRAFVEELMYALVDDRLTIRSEWSERIQDFRRADEYTVGEFSPDVPGRGFRLDRSAEAIERDPDGVTHYSVLVPEMGVPVCDCRGAISKETVGGVCKHAAIVRHLVVSGHL